MAEAATPTPKETQNGVERRYLKTALSFLIPFTFFFVADEWFFADPYYAAHFSVSLIFAFAPIVCLYLGWPAMIGCAGAEALVCIPQGRTVDAPLPWLVGLIAYVVVPYVLWYLLNARATDPYPRCSRAGSVAKLFLVLIVGTLVYALIAPLTAHMMDREGPYWWGLLTTFFSLTSITLTIGIVALVALQASPVRPRPPLWIHVPYEQRSSLSLTQRIVLVFAALTTVTLVGLILAFYAFLFPESGEADLEVVELLAASLVLGDVVVFVLWFFGILTIGYLQTRFTIPIERLSASTRAFPADMAGYQSAVDEGEKGERLAQAKAKAADPVDMGDLEPSGEVADLVADTDTMRATIVRYLDEVRSVTAENERVQAELDIANQIQQGAVPHDFEELDEALHVQVAAAMKPARDVGGDFYDAFRIDATHLGVIMADVSGKGMPAALFMMRALADLREQMHSHADDVGLALTRANGALCENNDAMLFVTGIIGILDVETGLFAFANAGHNPPWILGEGTWLRARRSLVLGMVDTVRYKTETLQLSPGGGLFLYTDGVTEAMNPADELYGDPRLDATLSQVEGEHGGEADCAALVDAVLASVHAFADGAPQSDDITTLAFRWLPA